MVNVLSISRVYTINNDARVSAAAINLRINENLLHSFVFYNNNNILYSIGLRPRYNYTIRGIVESLNVYI